MVLGASPFAFAQGTWRTTPSVSAAVTWTNNVDLDSSDRESDWVFTIVPAIGIDYRGARTSLRGSVAVPISIYAGTGEENNSINPSASLAGTWEAIDDLFFIDASANVSQTYYSAFGARPPGVINATENRYTSQTYQISPYLQRYVGRDISWSIRDDNIWSNVANSPEDAGWQYVNRLFGTINREARPFGWGADIERTAYRFVDQEPQTLSLVRARATWRPDPQLEMFVSGGYEKTDFPLNISDYSGTTYGAGFRWRPNERTRFDGSWEHRFYGESYDVAFDYRRRISFWNLRAYRTLTSYAEQIVDLQQGASVSAILDRALQSRIPDADERTRFIAEFMSGRGLPEFVDQPISIYSQRLSVVQGASASVGLVGVRNSLIGTVYTSQTQPITGAGQEIPPEIAGNDANRQYGVGASWSYQLSPLSSFALSAGASRAEAEPPLEDRSNQFTLRAIYTATIGARTTAFCGASWQNFDSNVDSDYTETSVFAGVAYRFW